MGTPWMETPWTGTPWVMCPRSSRALRAHFGVQHHRGHPRSPAVTAEPPLPKSPLVPPRTRQGMRPHGRRCHGVRRRPPPPAHPCSPPGPCHRSPNPHPSLCRAAPGVPRPPLQARAEKSEVWCKKTKSEVWRAAPCWALPPSTPTPSILPTSERTTRKTTASSGPCPESFRAGKKTPVSLCASCSIATSEPKPRALSFRSRQSSSVRGLPGPPRAQGTLPDPPLRQDNLSPMFSSSWRGLAAAHGSPAPLPAPAAKRERRGL